MKTLYSAFDVADYFLYKAQTDQQELLSNLKLQKMVYYAQGLYLAMHNKPIFKDEIKAWNYGPVIPELYTKYKKYGSAGIPVSGSFDSNSIDDDMKRFLDEVYSAFGQFSATRLSDLTHTDECWIKAYPNKLIKHSAMASDLKKYLKNG